MTEDDLFVARHSPSLIGCATLRRRLPVLALVLALAAPAAAWADGYPAESRSSAAQRPRTQQLDHSGHKRVGKASYYARRFAGRKMANGKPMRPESDNAASKTLPLGTTARVTNLHNGKSEVVTIEDRGPYIRGRIVDVSPRTARRLGFLEQGVARVEVEPLSIPQPDGSVKWLVGEAEPHERRREP